VGVNKLADPGALPEMANFYLALIASGVALLLISLVLAGLMLL
jgi:hypothetical protein